MHRERRFLRSRYFDPMEFDPACAFRFPEGIPAFESERAFAPIELPGQQPLLYLQSLSREDLCLITLPVRAIVSDYALALPRECLSPLGFRDDEAPRMGEDLLCLAIITVGADGRPAANLLAPIVVNLRTRHAVQAIQYGSPYGFRHPIPEACEGVPC